MTEDRKRRISFSADSVLSAVVQDADTTELVRILGHHRDEVSINQVNHVGLSALHHGVLSNNLDAIKLLLCNGADVNMQDVHGFSPLHTAAACGFVQVCSLLLIYGADVFALTAHREFPIDVAKDIGVIRLLTEEMRGKFHQELYLTSILRSKAWDCIYFLRTHTLKMMNNFLQFIFHLWKRHRTKMVIEKEE